MSHGGGNSSEPAARTPSGDHGEPASRKRPPIMLTGILGDSDQAGMQRIYLTAARDYYAEFATRNMQDAQPAPRRPWPGAEATHVTLAPESPIRYAWVENSQPPDEFDLDLRLGAHWGSGSSAAPVTHACPTGNGTCDNTCGRTCTCHTCDTCDTQCDQATCAGTCTCDTQCHQHTCTCITQCRQWTCTCLTECEQETCSPTCFQTCTCDTCWTHCGGNTCEGTCQETCLPTCQTCRTDCNQHTCDCTDGCPVHTDTCHGHACI